MMMDSIIVTRKELYEVLSGGANARRQKINLIVFTVIFGVFFPQRFGVEWVSTSVGLISLAWLSIFLSSTIVINSVAGERERHTLETLLASRLTDRAILNGKIMAGMIYAMGFAVVITVISLLSVNLLYWDGSIILFNAVALIFFALFVLVLSFLVGNIAVLISIKADSVRQAQQYFTFALFALFIPGFGLQFVPSHVSDAAFAKLASVSLTFVAIVLMLVILALDVVFYRINRKRFTRWVLMEAR